MLRKGILGLASLLIAFAARTDAAITSVGPASTDVPQGPIVGGLPAGPWSLVLPFTLDFTPGSPVTWSSGNWFVSLADSNFGNFHVVQVEGQHLVAPHPGETAPGPVSLLGVLFPQTIGSGGSAYGRTQHHVAGPGGDDWLLDVSVDPGGRTASGAVYAWHAAVVPEPATYVAGIGALGMLGLFWRKRQ